MIILIDIKIEFSRMPHPFIINDGKLDKGGNFLHLKKNTYKISCHKPILNDQMLNIFFLRLEMRQKWLSLKLYWRSLTSTIGNKKFKDWMGRNEAIFPKKHFWEIQRISKIRIT